MKLKEELRIGSKIVRPGDKVQIRQSSNIPGFSGLNFDSLREDGWTPGMMLTVFKIYVDDDIEVRWDDGTYTWEKSRVLRPGEIVIPPRSFESLPEMGVYILE